MHPNRDHAWSLRHVTRIILSNAERDVLYTIEHTSGENGFPLQDGEFLVLPCGETFEVKWRELRYVASNAGAGTFKTTAYLDVFVSTT